MKTSNSTKRVFVIGEAGVNHNGDIELAKQLVDAAIAAEVDAIKFQLFKAESLANKFASKADYQKRTSKESESQLEMLKKLELGPDSQKKLLNYCEDKIEFLSSPFDLESIDVLSKLKLGIFKIPSGEITNLPYLRKIGGLKKKVILSTGMSNLKEIKDALDVLVGAGTQKEDITVLHCNTAYPTFFEDVNLLAMVKIRETLGVKVGYSDHTRGIEIPIAAVALGAEVVEKHFTLDRNMDGPDHKASLEPDELGAMVRAIRNTEIAFGDGVKRVSKSEESNKLVARKSLVAAKDIEKGVVFTESNIAAKRPGTGLSPMQWDAVIGKKAKMDFEKDNLIEL